MTSFGQAWNLMNCVSCNQPVSTAYCPSCGQRSGVKRITFRDTIRDFWLQVVGLDGILLRTLRDLTMRPGLVALRYIAGVRVAYLGPIAYFFFMITLLLLWISVLGLDFAELIRDKQQTFGTAQASQKASQLMAQWVSDHLKWFLFLAVPFQAFAARYFFFRKSGYNFIEHTVPLFYTSAHLFWLTMLFFAIRSYTGSDLFLMASSPLSLIYFGYVYSDLMRYQSKVKAFFKGIGVYFGGQILFVVSLTTVIIIVVLIAALIDPKLLEGFRPSKH
jgi:hypothetical protein